MAEDPTNPSGTSSIPQVTSQNISDIKDYNQLLQNLGKIESELFSKLVEFSKSVSDNTKTLTDNKNVVGSLNKETIALAENLGEVVLALGAAYDGFEPFKSSIGTFTDLNNQTKFLTENISKLGAAIGAGSQNFSKLSTMIANMPANLANAAAQGQLLERGFISLSGASGNMNSVFDLGSNSLQSLDDKVRSFNARLIDTADATGLSTKEVNTYANSLGHIPGAFDSIVNVGGSAGKNIDGFTAALRVAAGTGQDMSQVTEVLNQAYEKLGNSNSLVVDNMKKGLEMFSLMSQASNTLGLRFSDTKKLLEDTAQSFNNIGDNSEATIRTLGRFTDALKSTGLTAKQSVDVVNQMVTSVSHLETGTKAFISARSGGPGGLQGAFRIDRMLREGKSDEVIGMIEKTLKQQFGGKIYTQDEADKSPQAAAGFFRQRELLKSSAFGGLVKDDASATKLLTALGSGNLKAGSQVISGGAESLQNTVERGTSIQERQTTILQSIKNSIDRFLSSESLKAYAQVRQQYGTDDEEIRNVIEKNMGEADERSLNLNIAKANGEFTPSTEQTSEESVRLSILGGLEEVGALFPTIGAKNKANPNKTIPTATKPTAAQSQLSPSIPVFGGQVNKFGSIVDRFGEYLSRVGSEERKKFTQSDLVPTGIEAANFQAMKQPPIELNIKVNSDDGLKTTVSAGRDQNANNLAALNGGVMVKISQ